MVGQTSFQPTAADFVTASRANFLRQLRSRRFVVRLMAASGIAWLLMTALMLFLGEELGDALVGGLYSSLMALAGILLFLGVTLLLIPRRVARLFRQSKAQQVEMTVQWSDDACFWQSSNGQQRHEWSSYHRWSVSPKCYCLYLNEKLYQFVPRRALTANQDQDLYDTLNRSDLTVW
ncbi:hypothetical protein C100_13420 [Sphingobium sp. C100]|jgi:hypothetical protein|uniref:YcxB family protein n=1 Tax=Sphingobium sp. C100 TaxID=1207055 RepID=UPI0003D5B9C4|nr:YcxB family protein [Sphingobium sp. C100]ETI63317.1 hypothetical protein C100_13420 [Sphingobium sp. C100]